MIASFRAPFGDDKEYWPSRKDLAIKLNEIIDFLNDLENELRSEGFL